MCLTSDTLHLHCFQYSLTLACNQLGEGWGRGLPTVNTGGGGGVMGGGGRGCSQIGL